MPWWQAEGYQAYLRYFIGAILGFGLIFFVLRPLVSHLTRTAEHNFKDELNETPIALQPPPAASITSNDKFGDSQALADQLMGLNPNKMSSDLLSNQNLPASGSPLTVQMEHLSLLANQEPARVAEVIAHWISDNDNT